MAAPYHSHRLIFQIPTGGKPELCLRRFSTFSAGLLLAGMAVQPSAFAAHPLQTEDTGTQGVGNIEVENGLLWTHQAGARSFVYQPQLSVGVLPTLDLIVQPSFQREHQAGEEWHSGFGDSNVDVKWRFYGSAPWSLGMRAGLQLATAAHTPGLPHGTVATHEVLVLTYDEAPLTVYGNLGMAQNPAGSGLRREIYSMSTAVLWTVNERLILTTELAAGIDADPHHGDWPATTLAGVIWTIVPGLDSDIGYELGLQPPAVRQWLAGLTYRFAY